MTPKRLALTVLLAAWVVPSVYASPVILSPTAVTTNTMGTYPCCSYNELDMINRNGLISPFTSGVTDFSAYIATDPQHTVAASGFEWFSPADVTSGTLVFDLGTTYLVDRVAAWADEYAGFGTTNVWTSTDGIFFTAVGTFTPTNHPPAGSTITYGADIALLTVSPARYVRFDILGPQTPREYEGLGIGEIAFSVSPAATAIPEPSSMMLLAAGIGALARSRRRRTAR